VVLVTTTEDGQKLAMALYVALAGAPFLTLAAYGLWRARRLGLVRRRLTLPPAVDATAVLLGVVLLADLILVLVFARRG
jgi:hypothetical protein